jgi:hypothetical protein
MRIRIGKILARNPDIIGREVMEKLRPDCPRIQWVWYVMQQFRRGSAPNRNDPRPTYELSRQWGRSVKHTRTLTRDELYELVWSEPVAKLASDIGISDMALAKRCKREGVPLSPRGYWARVAPGQSPARPPLGPKPEARPKSSAKRTNSPPVKQPEPPPVPIRRISHRYKSRLGRTDHIEKFWCKIVHYQRNYWFGVNWRPSGWNHEWRNEYESLTVLATIRSKTKKP